MAGLLGTVATQASKAMAHSISFGVNLAVTTNMLQFVWRNENKKRKEKRTSRRRPVLFLFSLLHSREEKTFRMMMKEYREKKKNIRGDMRCLSLSLFRVCMCITMLKLKQVSNARLIFSRTRSFRR